MEYPDIKVGDRVIILDICSQSQYHRCRVEFIGVEADVYTISKAVGDPHLRGLKAYFVDLIINEELRAALDASPWGVSHILSPYLFIYGAMLELTDRTPDWEI